MAIGVAERFGQAFGMRVVRAEEQVVDRHQLRELRYVLLPERIEKDAAPDRLPRVLAIELRHLLANVTEVLQQPGQPGCSVLHHADPKLGKPRQESVAGQRRHSSLPRGTGQAVTTAERRR